MSSGASERREFLPTRWSLLQRARSADSSEARQALEELCREYWFPLYAFVRRRGFDAHEAEDVVQSFLARLIEKGDLGSVSPAKGRFRSFLLAALQNFVANWRAREQSLKRGGGARRVEFDVHEADERLGLVAQDSEPPELVFERAWARELMQRCVADLETEYRTSGRGPVFDALKTALQSSDYDSSAAVDALGLTEGAVKVAVHRLRARFRERLRARIAQTVSSASEVEDELDDLFRALT